MELPDPTSLLSSPDWQVQRSTYRAAEDAYYEKLFTLANGYAGLSATVNFDNPLTHPGFYLATVYERGLAVRNSISNLPNFLDVALLADGERLQLRDDSEGSFIQTLDMKHGLCHVACTFVTAKGNTVSLAFVIILHASRKNLAMILGRVRTTVPGGRIILELGTHFGVYNRYLWALSPALRIQHWRPPELAWDGTRLALTFPCHSSGSRFACDSAVLTGSRRRHVRMERERVVESIQLAADEGDSSFCRIVGFCPSSEDPDPEGNARQAVTTALETGCHRLIEEHLRWWRKRWRSADIEIRGDARANEGARFAVFHLLQSYREDASWSVPARGFSSDYHSGHHFFNTELFIIFFFLYTDPRLARNLLQFRHRTLAAARRHAAATGYAGARFPEEADHEGNPDSPFKIIDHATGRELEEWSGKEVYHISAGVAFAIESYIRMSGDHEWMLDAGLEMLIETARFNASLAAWDHAKGTFVIRQVMGPDEYHYHIDNNYYTNYLAAWTLRLCLRHLEGYRRSNRERVRRIEADAGLTDNE
ncbi:glycoside hydrolase family 65 protein, partial [bacterium]|nr:glycoside hydrolase family 65 protein [candidate division CSSED10-310 bacterium]